MALNKASKMSIWRFFFVQILREGVISSSDAEVLLHQSLPLIPWLSITTLKLLFSPLSHFLFLLFLLLPSLIQLFFVCNDWKGKSRGERSVWSEYRESYHLRNNQCRDISVLRCRHRRHEWQRNMVEWRDEGYKNGSSTTR